MEPEGSSPHSQAPATCPYPEPAQSSRLLKVHPNITLPSTPGSPQRSLPLGLTHYEQKCVQAILFLVASTSSYDMSLRARDMTLSQCMKFRVTEENHVSLDAIHILYF